MAKEMQATKTEAEIQELKAKVGPVRPREQERADRLLEGEVFTDPEEAREYRAGVEGKTRHTRVNVGGTVYHVVREV